MTKEEAGARVAKGAALLDKKRPGWARAIDLHTLSLGSCAHCVLGQLLGDYHNYDDLNLTVADTRALGFNIELQNVETTFEEFAKLQNAWIDAIADRLVAPVQALEAPVSLAAADPHAEVREREPMRA